MKLEKSELAQINGGAVSATMLNAIARFVNTVYDIGYAIGSSLKNFFNRNYCSTRKS